MKKSLSCILYRAEISTLLSVPHGCILSTYVRSRKIFFPYSAWARLNNVGTEGIADENWREGNGLCVEKPQLCISVLRDGS